MSASTDALVAAKEALTTGLAQHGEAAIALIDAALAENEDTSAPLAELLGPAKNPAVEEEAEEAEAEIEPEAVEPEAEAGAGDASVEPQADGDGQTSESPAAESAESSDDGGAVV